MTRSTQPVVSETALVEYAQLKAQVRETLVLGQQRIEAARVLTYWRTGWAIRTHIKLHAGRADYGAQVLERLGKDLEVDASVLGRCVRFFDRLPQLVDADDAILAHGPKSSQPVETIPSRALPLLTWSHYRLLITVDDERQRTALLQEATRRQWSAMELAERIRRDRLRASDPAALPQLLTPKRGALGLFRVTDIGDTRYVDLGFESYRELAEAEVRRLHAGDLVRAASDGTLERAPDAKPADLYTYEAEVLRVTDADTLWMLIHLTSDHWRKEKLRLRGIDCPERGTARGETATRAVQGLLRDAKRLVITSTKPDQWDRYLSDVYLTPAAGDDIFLNNRLLELGHARRYNATSPDDWEP